MSGRESGRVGEGAHVLGRLDEYRVDYCHDCQTAPIERDDLCRFCVVLPPAQTGSPS